jgi:diguanylate cyclase (GGDEF)-like protein
VTASFGVAQLQPDMQRYEDLLKNADTALYIAKEEGRNRVVLYEKRAL